MNNRTLCTISIVTLSEHHQRGQKGFLEMKMLSLLVNQFMDTNVANLIENNTTIYIFIVGNYYSNVNSSIIIQELCRYPALVQL